MFYETYVTHKSFSFFFRWPSRWYLNQSLSLRISPPSLRDLDLQFRGLYLFTCLLLIQTKFFLFLAYGKCSKSNISWGILLLRLKLDDSLRRWLLVTYPLLFLKKTIQCFLPRY